MSCSSLISMMVSSDGSIVDEERVPENAEGKSCIKVQTSNSYG